MKRSTNKQVDLIVTADWHLMEKNASPPCRTDSIWEAQWSKVKQVRALQEKYKCPVYVAGDLFEHWKTSPELLTQCICCMPERTKVIYGNHDLPQHNIELAVKSGLGTLIESDIVGHVQLMGDWGFDWQELGRIHKKKRRILLLHLMTWKKELPWQDCPDPECYTLFKMFPDADLIITGHNHKTFTAKKGKQLLINPGSLTRHKADQINHKPCVFLWNAKTNTTKAHYLEIDKGAISREHIEVKAKKEERINAFVSSLKKGWDVELSFEDNINKAIKKEKLPKKLKQLIYKWLGR